MKYYVYTLSHNGIVFYVGKGSGRRMYIHEKRAKVGIKSNNNSALYEKILSILSIGDEIDYFKIYETDDEIDSYKIEVELIDKIGLDNLCNLTRDYLKTSVSEMVKNGLKKSEKFKKVIENKRSPEIREYYRIINTGENNHRYGKKNTPEHNEAIFNSLKDIPKSIEHRNKISNSLKRYKKTKKHLDNISKSLKNSENFKSVVKSEAFREKHRKISKKRHDEKITYYFKYNESIVIHKGGLKNMTEDYSISFYYLKKLRYGDIDEYKGWKFIKMENED